MAAIYMKRKINQISHGAILEPMHIVDRPATNVILRAIQGCLTLH